MGCALRGEQDPTARWNGFSDVQTMMSYAIDVYRNDVKPVRNLLDFGFYVSFFPQLVAGPIVRAAEFIPQMYEEFKLTRAQFGMAVFWIMNGLANKIELVTTSR